jgi:hypothetical protein
MMGSLRSIAAGLALVLLAASCGLSIDESARPINSQDLPPELRLGQLPTPTPKEASLSGPGSNQVHMIQNNHLVTVQRQIVSTPEELIEILLLATFPEEAANGIRSALDFQTSVQNIDVNTLFNLAIVDLAPGSLDPRNSEQRVAFAQIVYTLTSLPTIESVQFVQTDAADPEAGAVELAVQTDSGTTLPGARVTRSDFALLSPDVVSRPSFDIPVITPTPTPDPNAPPRFELPIWMLDADDKLIKVPRQIERNQNAFLIALIEGPLADERALGVRSAIPPDALANPVTISSFNVKLDDFGFSRLVSGNIAMVDLAEGSLPSLTNGDERFLAAAQIVYTLTDLEEIDQVVFFIDGVAIPMPADRGLNDGDLGYSLPFDPNIPSGLGKSDYESALLQPLEPPTVESVPVPTVSPEE